MAAGREFAGAPLVCEEEEPGKGVARGGKVGTEAEVLEKIGPGGEGGGTVA